MPHLIKYSHMSNLFSSIYVFTWIAFLGLNVMIELNLLVSFVNERWKNWRRIFLSLKRRLNSIVPRCKNLWVVSLLLLLCIQYRFWNIYEASSGTWFDSKVSSPYGGMGSSCTRCFFYFYFYFFWTLVPFLLKGFLIRLSFGYDKQAIMNQG